MSKKAYTGQTAAQTQKTDDTEKKARAKQLAKARASAYNTRRNASYVLVKDAAKVIYPDQKDADAFDQAKRLIDIGDAEMCVVKTFDTGFLLNINGKDYFVKWGDHVK